MLLQTYLNNRRIFEARYAELIKDKIHIDSLYVNLHAINQSFHNFENFINVYAFDKRPEFINIVNSIDRRKRYTIYKVGGPFRAVLKIRIDLDNKTGLIDKYPDRLKDILTYVKKQKTR